MRIGVLALCCLLSLAQAAPAARPMTLDDLFRFKRVADPQISPDGKLVAYVVTTSTWTGTRRRRRPLAGPPTGKRRAAAADQHRRKKDRHPRWSPTASTILFESNRSGDDAALGHRPRRRRGPAADHHQHRGRHRHLVARRQADRLRLGRLPRVLRQAVRGEQRSRTRRSKEEIEKNPVKAKVFTRLFYRHWDDYVEDKRQHLFVMPADGRRADAT